MNSYIAERKDILERVKSLLIEQLNLDLEKDEIDNDAPLFGMGLGLDSLIEEKIIYFINFIQGGILKCPEK
ncbi:MAG: hypothetical protein N2314_04605, partial [Brevinematales bacterium]|nr:hypothetical protein [Brevinematales bacterium]